MIFRNSFPNSPLLKIYIDRASVPDSQIVSVDLHFAENKHDMAVITYSGFPGMAVTEYRGLPVAIELGNNEASITRFVGYVAYVDVEANTRMGIVNKSLIQAAKVVCFGASYEMKAIKSTFYEDYTLPKLVSDLAQKYNMSYSVPNNNYTFTRIEQGGKSDWELLVNTANSIGYNVQVNGTHIHIYDPFSAYFRSQPVTLLQNLAENTEARGAGNIYEFKGTFGDITPDGGAVNWNLKSLDIRGKEIEYETASLSGSRLGKRLPSRFTHEITLNTVSQEALQQITNKYEKQMFPMNAEVSVVGVSTALPGRLALVSRYDSMFDAHWLISEVTHSVNQVHYITKLKIKTDSTNENEMQTVPGSGFKEPPAATLRNNYWASSKEFAYVY